MLQILNLNALYPLTLVFVSLETDVSFVSLYGLCVFCSRDSPNMVMTIESEDNLQ